jgi:membrane-associated phospholipid phosphatase
MKRALIILVACAQVAHGDPEPVKHHLAKHAAFVVGGGLAWIISETAFKKSLAPDTCRWCATDGLDTSVRDALKWRDDRTGTANALSYLTGFLIVPAVPYLISVTDTLEHRGVEDGLDDGIAIAEAGVATALLDQTVKFAAGRQRPFVHFAAGPRQGDSDDNLSFYSGHTSLAFALATAGGTIASKRHQRLAPLVWGLGLGFAATTGYLRIAADKHYATDVLTGAAVGSAAGLLLPRVFHDHAIVAVPMPNGVAVTGVF